VQGVFREDSVEADFTAVAAGSMEEVVGLTVGKGRTMNP
jgi:hypothetical protein